MADLGELQGQDRLFVPRPRGVAAHAYILLLFRGPSHERAAADPECAHRRAAAGPATRCAADRRLRPGGDAGGAAGAGAVGDRGRPRRVLAAAERGGARRARRGRAGVRSHQTGAGAAQRSAPRPAWSRSCTRRSRAIWCRRSSSGPPDDMPAEADSESATVSRTLVRALQGAVAGAVEPLDPRRLIPLRPAVSALGVLAGGRRAGTALALQRWPDLIRGIADAGAPADALRGRGDLAGAAGRRPAHLVRIPGLHRPAPARGRRLDRRHHRGQGDQGAARGAPAAPHAQGAAAAGRGRASAASCRRSWCRGVLSTELTLNESGTYRFWLAPILGRPVRELRSHQHDRRGRRPAARRDPRPGRPAGAADAAADRDRVHRRRRLRPGPGRAGLPHRRSARAAPAAARRARRARGAGAHGLGSGVGGPLLGGRAHRLSRSRPRIATRCRARRSDRRARSTS